MLPGFLKLNVALFELWLDLVCLSAIVNQKRLRLSKPWLREGSSLIVISGSRNGSTGAEVRLYTTAIFA